MAQDLASDFNSEKDTDSIRGIFDFYDAFDRGYITHQQLRTAMKMGEGLNETEIAELIENVDPRQSGKIMYEPFCAYILSK